MLDYKIPQTENSGSRAHDNPFGLFFKDSKWLNQKTEKGDPPILIGNGLLILRPERKWSPPRVVYLYTEYALDYENFQKSLLPFKEHICSHYQYSVISFLDHNVLLCFSTTRSKGNTICYPCRWPAQLSEATENGRRSAYHVWGTDDVLFTSDVAGMIDRPDSSKCSLVTTIGLRHPKSVQVSFCRYLYMDLLHEIVDWNGTAGWEKGFGRDAESGSRLWFIVQRGLPGRCPACKDKGYDGIYQLSENTLDI